MSNKNQHPRDLGLDLQKTVGSSENTTVDFDTKETRQRERESKMYKINIDIGKF